MKITILLQDFMGGAYYNALNVAASLRMEGHESSFILIEQTDRPTGARITDLTDFPSQTFSFSSTDNKHYLFRKLAAMIPDDCDTLLLNGLTDFRLVAHRLLGQKVIAIIHGDYSYYYEPATLSESRIDHFVGVSAAITGKLTDLMPHRKNDIVFIPPIVLDMRRPKSENTGQGLRIIFVGRLTPEKGFDLLPLIDEELKQRGIACVWTVIASHTTDRFDDWLYQPTVHYHERMANKDMAEIYARQDILLLPSHAEGFPLCILEAMQCGVVPVATDLPTLSGVINHGDTGFLFGINDIAAITAILARLSADPPLLRQTGIRAENHAASLYSEPILRKKWTELLSRVQSGKDLARPVASVYDRMDLPWLPNALTRKIRKLKARGKGKGKSN
jgi:glycosyltransferase involved in cell wall biosynthesis